MSWKKKFQGLYNRLRVALGNPSEIALDKRVTRAAAMALTTEEALFVLANKKGVGFSREFTKLSKESQNRVNSTINKYPGNVSIASGVRARSKGGRTITFNLKTPLGKINDPFLPSYILRDAVDMSETAYPYLYILENSLRNFILLVLQRKYGANWWNVKMHRSKTLDNIAKTAQDRMRKEERNSYHGKRATHNLYYIDFPDLISILRSLQADFNPFFNNLPGKLIGFTTKLEELFPSRNVTAHHNPLSKRDKNRLVGYLHDWLSQLAYLKNKEQL